MKKRIELTEKGSRDRLASFCAVNAKPQIIEVRARIREPTGEYRFGSFCTGASFPAFAALSKYQNKEEKTAP